MPSDIESHLEFVLEGLHEIESEFDIYEKDKEQSTLYTSQLGKFLVVIRKIVLDTYPDHDLSENIAAVIRRLLHRSSHYIVKAVLQFY